ncbi:sigma-54-dependent Fis family transcriptional regulator [Polyangium jinanense]|uniref:sigma-54-dependent transcriptional regulator n=1 Tax=Polyangium jinanense TaxID=2829994 RepID=UPI00233FDF1A|nr:sigma-54 dependent transcriptional regulator [Polyangium jinanense]MDC3958063.1 sigma-54-dependent Fis family transcriptional regulator [Polyangium jinanense]
MNRSSASILVVDDDAGFRRAWRTLLEAEGLVVLEAGAAEPARATFLAKRPRLVLLDLMLPPSGLPKEGAALLDVFLAAEPRVKVVVVSGTGETQLALDLVRRGAYDFIEKPVDPDVLLAVLARARARLDLEDRVTELEDRLAATGEAGLLGSSPAFVEALSIAERAAPADLPVLVTGASGTGKELFARRVHARSRRREGPFVAVNCGALAPSLLESTLFGHKKGAFTGAIADGRGLFVEADGGTLFLDEIGDLELALQVKLLRALESGEVLPVGAGKPVRVDVRIVSATHRPLEQMVRTGTFREDLYWRIRGIEITLPSLVDRTGDLAVLAQHFLNEARALVPGAGPTTLSKEALRRLEDHDWPGNLRELRHEMQRALVMAAGRSEILEADLSPALRRSRSAAAIEAPAEDTSLTLEQKIERLERAEITRALAECQGNRSQAAQRLGLSRQGLLNKLDRYGLR